MHYEPRFARVSDDDLLRGLTSLVGDSRRVESDLVAHIGEVEERRLYAREGCPSMFAYCTEVLHLSSAEAYLRITAARAARDHPVVLEMLGDGRLHLSGIAKLVPHLTPANASRLLARAVHRSKRQIEELIAEIAPRPDAPVQVRKLPRTPAPSATEAPARVEPPVTAVLDVPSTLPSFQLRPDGVASSVASAPAAEVEPLSPARYKVQFTASAELRDKLERLRKLLGISSDDLALVIDQAVTEKLERLEKKRFALTKTPRPAPSEQSASRSRYLPSALRRAVYLRDGGQCCFVSKQGRRCTERNGLEYHHRYPYSFIVDNNPSNICLMC